MFLECIKELIRIDKDWVPKFKDTSLYVRPTYIGTEVRYRGGGGVSVQFLIMAKSVCALPYQYSVLFTPFLNFTPLSSCTSSILYPILFHFPIPMSPFSHSHVPILPSPIPHFPSPILLFLYFPFSCLHLHLCHFAIILQFSIPALYRCPCL